MTKLQKEQHLNSELAAKISEIGVELEEKKSEVGSVFWSIWNRPEGWTYQGKIFMKRSDLPKDKVIYLSDE